MALAISHWRSFEKRSKRKSTVLQEKLWRQIELLRVDPQYPSLRVKKVRGVASDNIWEASIDMDHRLTFEYSDDGLTIILRNCNGHEVFNNP